MEAFWNLMRWALRPGGCIVYLDDSTAKAEIEEFVAETRVPTVRRKLADGSQHLAVKVLYDAPGLTSRSASAFTRLLCCPTAAARLEQASSVKLPSALGLSDRF